MSVGGPQAGYKLVLVPDGDIVADESGNECRVLLSLFQDTPYEVIGDVGPDRRLRMSRALYETVEVVG